LFIEKCKWHVGGLHKAILGSFNKSETGGKCPPFRFY